MKISQVEARRLKRRVAELERQEDNRRSTWATTYPGGTHVLSVTLMDNQSAVIKTARRLRHAVVVTCDGSTANFYALPIAGTTP